MAITDVFRELAAARVAGVIQAYGVGGAVAATFYLEPSATEDVDIFVVLPSAPAGTLLALEPVYEFLRRRGATVKGEHLVVSDWQVQLLPAPSVLVEDALATSVAMRVAGVDVPVFDAEHLAAIALETGRSKDKLRLKQFLESGVLDVARFRALIDQFGLESKWTRVQSFLKDE